MPVADFEKQFGSSRVAAFEQAFGSASAPATLDPSLVGTEADPNAGSNDARARDPRQLFGAVAQKIGQSAPEGSPTLGPLERLGALGSWTTAATLPHTAAPAAIAASKAASATGRGAAAAAPYTLPLVGYAAGGLTGYHGIGELLGAATGTGALLRILRGARAARAEAPAAAPVAEAVGPQLNWLERFLAKPPIENWRRQPAWRDQPVEAPPAYEVPRPAPTGTVGARPAPEPVTPARRPIWQDLPQEPYAPAVVPRPEPGGTVGARPAPTAPAAAAPRPVLDPAPESPGVSASDMEALRKLLGLKRNEPIPFRIPPQPIRPSPPPAKWSPEELAPPTSTPTPAPAAAPPATKPTVRISVGPPEGMIRNDTLAAAEHLRRMRMRDEADFSHFRQQDLTPPMDTTIAGQPTSSMAALPAARLHANRNKPLAPLGDPNDPEYIRALMAYYERQALRGEH